MSQKTLKYALFSIGIILIISLISWGFYFKNQESNEKVKSAEIGLTEEFLQDYKNEIPYLHETCSKIFIDNPNINLPVVLICNCALTSLFDNESNTFILERNFTFSNYGYLKKNLINNIVFDVRKISKNLNYQPEKYPWSEEGPLCIKLSPSIRSLGAFPLYSQDKSENDYVVSVTDINKGKDFDLICLSSIPDGEVSFLSIITYLDSSIIDDYFTIEFLSLSEDVLEGIDYTNDKIGNVFRENISKTRVIYKEILYVE